MERIIERSSNIAVWAGLFAGLFAAVLTIVLPLAVSGFGSGIFIGTIFGVVISIYFWVVLRTRSVEKTIGFVMASTLAFALAQYSTVFSADFIGFDLKTPMSHGTFADRAPVLAFVIGGTVGGFVVVLAALHLFSVENRPSRVLVKALQWSMAGGTLGAIGWAIGPFLGGINYSMFLAWETGMGLTLGLLLALEEAPVESH